MNVAPADPASPDARVLTAELDAALQAITGDSGASSFDPEDVRGPQAVFMIARGAARTAGRSAAAPCARCWGAWRN